MLPQPSPGQEPANPPLPRTPEIQEPVRNPEIPAEPNVPEAPYQTPSPDIQAPSIPEIPPATQQ